MRGQSVQLQILDLIIRWLIILLTDLGKVCKSFALILLIMWVHWFIHKEEELIYRFYTFLASS